MKIKFDNQEWHDVEWDVPYLTAGKEYEVVEHGRVSDEIVYIIADSGNKSACLLSCCAHLKGKPWTIVEE